MRYIGGRFELRKSGFLAKPIGNNKVAIYSEIDAFEDCSIDYFVSEYVYRDGREIDKLDLGLTNSPLPIKRRNRAIVEAKYDTKYGVWLVKYNKRVREYKSGMFYYCFEPYREESENEIILNKFMRTEYKIKCTYMSRAGAFESVWTMELEPDRYAYYEGNLKLITIPRDRKPLYIRELVQEIKEWTEASGIQKVLGYKLLEKETGKIFMEF